MFFISQANLAGAGILDLIPCPFLLEGEGGLWISITSLRGTGEMSKQDIFGENPSSIPCHFFFRVLKDFGHRVGTATEMRSRFSICLLMQCHCERSEAIYCS